MRRPKNRPRPKTVMRWVCHMCETQRLEWIHPLRVQKRPLAAPESTNTAGAIRVGDTREPAAKKKKKKQKKKLQPLSKTLATAKTSGFGSLEDFLTGI